MSEDRWRALAHRLLDLAAEGFEHGGASAPCGPTPCGPPADPPNHEWRWLSPTEEQAVAALSPSSHTTAGEIATALGVPLSNDFRFLLRNLVARRILDSSPAGYRLRGPAPGTAPEG